MTDNEKLLAKAGIETKDGKVKASDVEKAAGVLASLSEEDYLSKVSEFRDKVIKLVHEAKALANEGKHLGGEYVSFDFDGDEHETHENLGDAFENTCELELVSSALYFLIENKGKSSEEDDED